MKVFDECKFNFLAIVKLISHLKKKWAQTVAPNPSFDDVRFKGGTRNGKNLRGQLYTGCALRAQPESYRCFSLSPYIQNVNILRRGVNGQASVASYKAG